MSFGLLKFVQKNVDDRNKIYFTRACSHGRKYANNLKKYFEVKPYQKNSI